VPGFDAPAPYTYRPSGALASRTYQGGPQVPLTYTVREFVAKIGDPAGTTYPFSARYTYHGNGTVSEAEFYSAGSPATNKRYKYVFGTSAYDALNRLKSADHSSWSGSAWTSTLAHDLASITYDASGNLKTLKRYKESGSLVDDLTYAYPSGSNRLSSLAEAAGASAETWDAEAGSFTHDANGNVATSGAPYALTAMTYDHRNLPTAATSSSVTTTYRYTEDGWRIAKQVGSGNTEIYVQDGPLTLAVLTVNSGGTATGWHFNVVADDRVVGRQPDTGNRSYYHTDLLGSTRAVLQGTTVIESYDYDPYGLLMPGRTLAGATKEGFTSKERDPETGLDYFGARYYMGAVGRWSSVDPVADSFPSWNPYNYVEGDPVGLVDPFGLCPPPPGEYDPLCTAGDVAAGFGDAVTFGLTRVVRDWIGAGGQVDESSGASVAGEVAGVAAATALGASLAGGAAAAGSGEGAIVIGETAARVEAAAAKLGAETFTPSAGALARGPRSIWRENRAWLEGAVRSGRQIIDIGLDVNRTVRGKFYRPESLLLKKLLGG